MGCFCCCFRVHDVEQNTEVDVSSNKYSCFNFIIKSIKNKYGASVANCGLHEALPPGHEPVIATTNVDTNTPTATSLPNIPSPSPRNLDTEQNLVVRINNTDSDPSKVECVPIAQNVQLNPSSIRTDKPVESSKTEESEARLSASSEKVFSKKGETGLQLVCCSSEEEDVCPTCLEDYTDENPMIATQCKHEYHLGCIYEWMERSPNCLICMKQCQGVAAVISESSIYC